MPELYPFELASFFSAVDVIKLEMLHTEDGVVLHCTGDRDIAGRFSFILL